MKNDKYLVVKVADVTWRDHPSTDGTEWPRTATITEDMVLPDATVIRGQDTFAAPALWAYANTIGIVAREIRAATADMDANASHELRQRAARLQSIADTFSQRAEEAAHTPSKLPD
jgi:hypothetical protein